MPSALDSRRFTALVLFALCAPLCAQTDRPRPPVHVEGGPPPFLTSVTEPENNKNIYVVQLPTAEVLAGNETYFDVPCALHIPFEVPYEGGPVRVYVDLQIQSDPPQAFLKNHMQRWELQTHGFYRLDHAAIPESAIVWWRGSDRLALRGHEKARFPLLVNATSGEEPDTRGYFFRATYTPERPPFQEPGRVPVERNGKWESEEGLSEFNPYPFVFDGAAPGMYAFWVALQPYFSQRGWPDGLGQASELRAKITCSVVVARSDRDLGAWHFGYLFGRRERFPEMLDDELCRVVTKDLSVKILRDGWLLDRAEIHPQVDAVKEGGGEVQRWSHWYHVAPKTSVSGEKVEVSIDAKVWETQSDGSRVEKGMFRTGWGVRFPVEIPDATWGDVEVTGYRERDPKDLYPATPPWDGGEHWSVDVEPEHGPISAGQHWLDEFVEPNASAKDFQSVYGDREDLKNAWYEQKWELPVRGGEPLRYRLLGASPHYVDREATLGERQEWPPLIKVDCEAWEVRAFYRRKKDVHPPGTDTAAGGVAGPVVNELDPFWDWYVTLTDLLADRMGIYHSALAECGTIGMAIEDHRRMERNLAALLVEELLPQIARERIEKRIEQALAELRGLREDFDKERMNAEAAIADVRTECERGYGLYVRTHPPIALWRDAYRDLEERLPIQFALLERDEDRLSQILEAAAVKGLAAPARMFEAQVRHERGDVIGALQALRSAKTLAPDDPEIDGTLMRMETEILKTLINKSQSGIQEGRAALYTYLQRRGFKEKSNGDPLRWYHVVTRPLHALTSEESWSGFTSGLLDLMGGALGTANEVERLLDAKQTELARAFLGLNLMLRLRMRGVTFAELRTLKTDEIFAKVPLRGPNGEAYPPSRARDLAVCMREAMTLPDAKALIEEDWPTLAIELKKGYWNERDIRETGAEWIGDMLSIKNVLLFAVPMSYGRIGGRLAGVGYWGANTQKVVAVANQLKLVQSGTEVLARFTGFARLIQLAGSTRAGKYFANMLQASAAFEESLTTAQTVGWTLQKLVAGMAIQGFAVHLAEEFGGPQAALAMEALLVLSTDGDFLMKMLRKGGGSPQAAAGFVRKQMIPQLTRARDRAKAIGERRGQLKLIEGAKERKLLPGKPEQKLLPPAPEVKLLEERFVQEARARSSAESVLGKLKQGETLTPADRATLADAADVLKVRDDVLRALSVKQSMAPQDFELLDRVMGIEWQKRIPKGLPEEDLEFAVLAAIDDLAKGQDRGALRAVDKMSAKGKQLIEDAERRLREAQELADLLGSAAHPPGKAPRTYHADIEGWLVVEGDYKLAEAALHANDFEGAKKLYTQHLNELMDRTQREWDDLRLQLVERKIKLCDELLADPVPIPLPTSVHPTSEAIDEGAVDEILARGFRPIKQEPNRVIGRSADGKYYLKEMDCSTADNLENALEEAEGELGAYELGRALGLDVPATTVRVDYAPDGRIVNVKILSKAIADGEKLSAMSAAEIFKHREMLSRLRALSTWLGDFDRHLGNYIPLGKGNRVFSMDHGYAGLRKHRAQAYIDHYQKPPSAAFEGELGRDHFLERGFDEARKAMVLKTKDVEDISKLILAEQSLTYNAAEPIVAGIKNLISPAGEPQLRELLENVFVRIYGGNKRHKAIQDKVGEAIRHLRTRGSRVEDLMKGLNDRNGIPLPGPKVGWRLRIEHGRLELAFAHSAPLGGARAA